MSTTTDTSTEPDWQRQAMAAHFAYGYITAMLDRDEDQDAMRRHLRTVLARFRDAGIGA